jgi:hypothetical protein
MVDVVRRQEYFGGFITCFLPVEPKSLMKASDAIPEMAPLDAAKLDGASPAHDRWDPTHGDEDGGHGQCNINKLGCTLQ